MLSLAARDEPGFSGSYAADDVVFLMTPLRLAPTPVAEKERLIQSGARHYSEMLAPESAPGPAYLAAYEQALAAYADRLAGDVKALAAAIAARPAPPVLVSLARAGTPIGVLLRRELARLGRPAPHYSISIIRDRGIDRVALEHIIARHGRAGIVFVDGWTGKGAIASELRGPRGAPAAGVAPFLAVVADPAGSADLAASGADYVIPSGLLNGIVSGLVSRSVLNAAIGPGDFHGCVRLDALAAHDRSRAFVDAIDARVRALPAAAPAQWRAADRAARAAACAALLARVRAEAGVGDLNRIKPGIAEATRAVLRRVPDRLFVADPADPALAHLRGLAGERGLALETLPDMGGYRAVAVIKGLGAA